ncbi:MAG: long-chain fatty acid--CoA ligase [Proteobacteria bacterium]|nr:MAG: long-chain fatty acid--CoA ligase [Pseudomonadota bacterium]
MMEKTLPWDEARTLIDVLSEVGLKFADEPAFTQSGQTLSFAELLRLSRRVAAYLQSREDLQLGDRVAVQIPNTLLYPVLAWGILQAGMVIVNLNPQYTPRETLRQLKDSGAKVWFCADISAHLIAEVRKDYDVPLVVTCRLFELHPWPQRNIYQFVLRYRRKAIRPYSEHRVVTVHSVLRAVSDKKWVRPNVKPSDTAMLQYTGGSSGVNMGAMLSHENLVANLEQVRQFLGDQAPLSKEILVAPLPLYHIFSFTVHCAAAVLAGYHTILIMDASNIKGMVSELRRVPFTIMTGVNTLFFALMRLDSFKELDFRSLKFAVAGGMKLDPSVAQKWQTLTGSPILEGFGMTELSPVASWNPMSDNRLGTIGKPLPFTEMKLTDHDGRGIETPNTPGELWVRGPQVMKGYWQQPEETSRHIDQEGWMRTGDLATFDPDNYWSIVGRKKRMILVSGFNVYPQEVEEVLRSHPDVTDARVVGRSHPVNGESIKAYIITDNQTLTVHALREYCRQKLTSYKLPKQIEVVAELPDSR